MWLKSIGGTIINSAKVCEVTVEFSGAVQDRPRKVVATIEDGVHYILAACKDSAEAQQFVDALLAKLNASPKVDVLQ